MGQAHDNISLGKVFGRGRFQEGLSSLQSKSQGGRSHIHDVSASSCRCSSVVLLLKRRFESDSRFFRNIDELMDSGEMNAVGMELAVSVMLSSLVRRGVCPNFVMTRGAFSFAFCPPASIWGNKENKCPSSDQYLSPIKKKKIRQPKGKGRYQFIRMELCDKGDAEACMKNLPDERIDPLQARSLLFQMAYALHTAAIRLSLKHYDVKLLNFFIQSVQSEQPGATVLRYQVGDSIFALKSEHGHGCLVKLGDYGTANVDATTNGRPITPAQITTPENTPIDYMLLGDSACQGHGHDNFGLGLCMLHLYTGHAPYEEIMEEVKCPPRLKKKLQELWEGNKDNKFSVIQDHILRDVDKDETGHIIEGAPDEVFYHTLYRLLVLFGLPSDVSPRIQSSRVWIAVCEVLLTKNGKRIAQYTRDCEKFSIDHGTHGHIARARESLKSMEGGIDLLKSLVSFDPDKRSTALDVMNSLFMKPLQEPDGQLYAPDDDVRSYADKRTQAKHKGTSSSCGYPSISSLRDQIGWRLDSRLVLVISVFFWIWATTTGTSTTTRITATAVAATNHCETSSLV